MARLRTTTRAGPKVSAMTTPVLQILIASTRPGRVGPSVAAWIQERALAHGGFTVELIDLAEVNLPMFDEPKHPRLREYTHQHTKDWSAPAASRWRRRASV